MNEIPYDEEVLSADEQYFRDLYNAQKVIEKHRCNGKQQAFIDWLYENYPIGNGHMLINLMENPAIQTEFLRDAGLPEDTEL